MSQRLSIYKKKIKNYKEDLHMSIIKRTKKYRRIYWKFLWIETKNIRF